MKKLKENFMAPFYGWGLNCLKAAQSHYEETVYFLQLSPYLIDLERLIG